jgi:hypothetical protein
LQREAAPLGAIVDRVSATPTALFEEAAASIKRLAGSSSIPLPDHIVQLRAEHAALQRQAERFHKTSGEEAMQGVTAAMDELQALSVLHERATALHAEQRMSLKDYEMLLAEANEDLERNKTTAKLRDLGASRI